MGARIPVPDAEIEQFCRRHRIVKLSLFGSVLGAGFRPDSDIDVLIEFESGAAPGLFALARMERELATLFGGRRVDLRTPADLSRYFRDEVMAMADVRYAQGR